MFIGIVLLLLGVSFLLSLFSLKTELKKNIKTEQVKDELAKGRVIFHAPLPNEPEQHIPEIPNPLTNVEHITPAESHIDEI